MTARLVVDCSLVIAWLLGEPSARAAEKILSGQGNAELLAPAIWPFEVANALLVSERRGRIGDDDAALAAERVPGLCVRVNGSTDDTSIRELVWTRRLHALTANDAAYLDLAFRSQCPLSTFDDQLAAAARQAGVAIIDS